MAGNDHSPVSSAPKGAALARQLAMVGSEKAMMTRPRMAAVSRTFSLADENLPWIPKGEWPGRRPELSRLVLPLVFCENRNLHVLKQAFEEELGFAAPQIHRRQVAELAGSSAKAAPTR